MIYELQRCQNIAFQTAGYQIKRNNAIIPPKKSLINDAYNSIQNPKVCSHTLDDTILLDKSINYPITKQF